jgi:hypothetical protein
VDDQDQAQIDQLNKSLEAVNEIAYKDKKYHLRFAHISEFAYLEKNARYMTAETFQNLATNIEKDNQLASVPLTCDDEIKPGKLKVLSGNHRLQAAAKAGLEVFLVFYAPGKLSHEEQVSIQLSHNALEGKDDPKILKELFAEIERVDLKVYSGLDDKILADLESVELPQLRTPTLDYQSLSFIFLPEDAQRVQKALEEATKITSAHTLYLARLADFQRLLESLTKTEASYEVKAPAIAIMYILDIFFKHQDDLSKGWEEEAPSDKRQVPLSSVLGSDMISLKTAHDMQRVIQRMKDKKELGDKGLATVIDNLTKAYLAKG